MLNRTQRARRRMRRQEKRAERKHERLAKCLDYDSATSFEALWNASKKCQKGVLWKHSVQTFCLHRALNCHKLQKSLEAREYVKWKPKQFYLYERGTRRLISSVYFRDRVVMKAFGDVSLFAVCLNSVTAENTATQKGKGPDYARALFERHMKAALDEYGSEACLYQYDFKNYFGSIDSARASDMTMWKYLEICQTSAEVEEVGMLMWLLMLFVCEYACLGLGNETSQVEAVFYASPIDHKIREVTRMPYSGRYMDDGYVWCRNRAEALEMQAHVERWSEELGLRVHPNKCKITKICQPVSFLKTRYFMDHEGNIETKVAKKTVAYSRRHAKGVKRLVESGKLTEADLEATVASFKSICTRVSDPKARKRMYRNHRRRFLRGVNRGR